MMATYNDNIAITFEIEPFVKLACYDERCKYNGMNTRPEQCGFYCLLKYVEIDLEGECGSRLVPAETTRADSDEHETMHLAEAVISMQRNAERIQNALYREGRIYKDALTRIVNRETEGVWADEIAAAALQKGESIAEIQ
jgi:hypothetical protein